MHTTCPGHIPGSFSKASTSKVGMLIVSCRPPAWWRSAGVPLASSCVEYEPPRRKLCQTRLPVAETTTAAQLPVSESLHQHCTSACSNPARPHTVEAHAFMFPGPAGRKQCAVRWVPQGSTAILASSTMSCGHARLQVLPPRNSRNASAVRMSPQHQHGLLLPWWCSGCELPGVAGN